MLPPKPREPDDLNDPARNKRLEAEASLRADRARSIERSLLETPEGREWIWALLRDCGLWTDGEMVPFQQGMREVGLQLMRRLARSSPNDFARMFTEQDSR
jgi:hypothetical protein